MGLTGPAYVWCRAGVTHPFWAGFNAGVGFVPDRNDRGAFGEAGMRHFILAPASGLASRRAALFGLRATAQVARALRD